MAGSINKLSNIFENKINDKPVKTEKNTTVFKSRKVNLQKTDTNSTHVANNQQKSENNTKNKAVDYDSRSVAGLNKNFKSKLETALATKPKKTGMISPKRNQKAISKKQHLQIEEQTTSKQQDVDIQPTTTSASVADRQTKIPTAPPVPPVVEHKNNKSLKANVNYQRKNNWNEIPAAEQVRPSQGTKTTTPKTKQSQNMLDELAQVLEKRKKS